MDGATLTDSILAALGDSDECDFTHTESDIHVRCKIGYGDQAPLTMRFVVPIGIDIDMVSLVYGLCFSLIAETGNNDTCDVIIRERSAHFGFHADLDGLNELECIVYDAVVLDYLS